MTLLNIGGGNYLSLGGVLLSTTALVSGGNPPPTTSGGANGAGWSPATDGGSTGDYFVDDATGSDANAGTSVSPYKTIQRAIDEAKLNGAAGKVIKVKGGIYTPPNTSGLNGTSSNPVVFEKWGVAVPVISGGIVLGSMTQCTSARSGMLGSGYANVYEQTVPNTEFSWGTTSNANFPIAAGSSVCEDGSMLNMAIDKRLPLLDFFQNDPNGMHTGTFNTSTAGVAVTTITDASVISNYTNAQLLNAHASVHYGDGGNLVRQVRITGASGDTINVSNNLDYETSRYALTNILPVLSNKVGWGYIDNGSTTTIFVRPEDSSNVAAGKITLTTETIGLHVQGDFLEFDGFRIVQAGGFEFNESRVINCENREGIHFRNCYIGEVDGTRADDRNNMCNMASTIDNSIRNSTVARGANGFGISYDLSTGLRVYYTQVHYTGGTAIRSLGSKNSIFAWLDFLWVSWGGHSNASTMYDISGTAFDSGILWGCRFRANKSYIVTKGGSNVFLMFNDIPCGQIANENRAISDDNGPDGQTPPSHPWDITPSGELWINNNSIFPDYKEATAGGCIKTPNYTVAALPVNMKNNIINGGGLRAARNHSEYKTNLFTLEEWWQRNSNENPVTMDASNTIEQDLAVNYIDAANGDYRSAATSPALSMTGTSIANAISAMKLRPGFTNAEIDALLAGGDPAGRVIDPVNPPIGAYVQPDVDVSTVIAVSL